MKCRAINSPEPTCPNEGTTYDIRSGGPWCSRHLFQANSLILAFKQLSKDIGEDDPFPNVDTTRN
jgi:hypothetical protein